MLLNPGFRLRLNPGPLCARPAHRGSWRAWGDLVGERLATCSPQVFGGEGGFTRGLASLHPAQLYARPARRGSWRRGAVWWASVPRPARRRSLAERVVYAGSRFAPPRAIVCPTRSPRVLAGGFLRGGFLRAVARRGSWAGNKKRRLRWQSPLWEGEGII